MQPRSTELSGTELLDRIDLVEGILHELQQDAVKLRARGVLASAMAFGLLVFAVCLGLLYWNLSLFVGVGFRLWVGWACSLATGTLCFLAAWFIFHRRLTADDSNIPPGFGFSWSADSSSQDWNFHHENLRGSGLAENILRGFQRDDVEDNRDSTRRLLIWVGNTIPWHYRRSEYKSPNVFQYVIQQLLLLGVVCGLLAVLGWQHLIPIAIPAIVLPQLFELHARHRRWVFYLPMLHSYLHEAYSYYREHPELNVDREVLQAGEVEVPQAVMLEKGQESLARLARELRLNLDKRRYKLGYWLSGWSVLQFFSAGLLGAMAIALSAMMLWTDTFLNLTVLAVYLILLALASLWLRRRLDNMATRWKDDRRKALASSGLLKMLATADLPVDELRSSCNILHRHMLELPVPSTDRDAMGFDQAWLLMWNLDWFLRREGSSIRPDFYATLFNMLSYPVMYAAVPVLMLILLEMNSQEMTAFSLATGFAISALVIFPAVLWSIVTFARHTAAAHAVVLELEALVGNE